MEIGNINDTQLDGDFLMLIEARKNRNVTAKNESVIQQLISLNERTVDTEKGSFAESLQSTVASSIHRKTVDTDLLWTQLLDAVIRNDVAALKSACKKVTDAGLNLTDSALRNPHNNATVLHMALIEKKWDVGKYLIQSHKDEKLLDDGFMVMNKNEKEAPSYKTCLHVLAEEGQYKMANILINHCTSSVRLKTLLNAVVLMKISDQRPRYFASIHLASLHGHIDFVKMLLSHGVDANCTSNLNDTPILWASHRNHIATVRLLLSRGAKLNLQNDEGSTPLYWAIRYGFSELTRLLVTEGRANVHQRRKLGLVTPIVLASALGHRDIVDVLLDNGADVEERIGNGTTALHAAALEGNDDVIELLLTKGHALVDQTDTAGNTALLCAAKVGNVATMNQLVLHGASIDAQNKLGETIWHYAIVQGDDTLLKAIAGLYRKYKRSFHSLKTMKFANGCNPFQIAVDVDCVHKVRSLIDIGVDIEATDRNGNTFYHLAARGGKIEIIQSLIDQVDLSSENSDGDTPLHLAAKFGHGDVIRVLIDRSNMDACNKLGMTPLHEAAGTENAEPEVIRLMIANIVNTHNSSLVDAVNSTGCTPLHIAARRGRSDILTEMAALNIAARNQDGDTPFHLSARGGHPYSMETMIQVFNAPGKGCNVDEKTKDGQSALHICAARGDWQRVELLVSEGADLSLQDNEGNTPLHIVVEESIKQPTIGLLLEVIRVIVRCAARWWCTTNGRQVPTDESELYYVEMRAAMIHLTSAVFNGDGLNVVALAIVRGAASIVKELLNTPNVYRFNERNAILYDVTYLTPRTNRCITQSLTQKSCDSKVDIQLGDIQSNRYQASDLKNAVRNNTVAADKTESSALRQKKQSCLELIASISDEVQAAQILDIEPFRQLVSDKWYRYQSIYMLLMAVHIMYMILYSFYIIPSSREVIDLYNITGEMRTTDCISFIDSPQLYGCFLLWPLMLVIFNTYELITYFFRWITLNGVNFNKVSPTSYYKRLIRMPFRAGWLFFEHLEELSAIIFGMSVIVWYVLYRCGTTAQAYVHMTALVFIIGWTFTLNYTKGFQGMHSFTIMIRHIIVIDFSRFLIMYIFVLLGFGLAFHVLFQISRTMIDSSPWITLFNVNNMILGLSSPYDYPTFLVHYTDDGGNVAVVYCAHLLFNFIASIVLVSLLVAMLTDSYSSVKANEGLTWKVNSLHLVLRFERSLPFIEDLLNSIFRDPVFHDITDGRWMMSLEGSTADKVSPKSASVTGIEAIQASVERLEAKIDGLNTNQEELAQRIYAVSESMPNMRVLKGSRNSTIFARHGAVKLRARPVLSEIHSD